MGSLHIEDIEEACGSLICDEDLNNLIKKTNSVRMLYVLLSLKKLRVLQRPCEKIKLPVYHIYEQDTEDLHLQCEVLNLALSVNKNVEDEIENILAYLNQELEHFVKTPQQILFKDGQDIKRGANIGTMQFKIFLETIQILNHQSALQLMLENVNQLDTDLQIIMYSYCYNSTQIAVLERIVEQQLYTDLSHDSIDAVLKIIDSLMKHDSFNKEMYKRTTMFKESINRFEFLTIGLTVLTNLTKKLSLEGIIIIKEDRVEYNVCQDILRKLENPEDNPNIRSTNTRLYSLDSLLSVTSRNEEAADIVASCLIEKYKIHFKKRYFPDSQSDALTCLLAVHGDSWGASLLIYSAKNSTYALLLCNRGRVTTMETRQQIFVYYQQERNKCQLPPYTFLRYSADGQLVLILALGDLGYPGARCTEELSQQAVGHRIYLFSLAKSIMILRQAVVPVYWIWGI
ncbi:hypothetical protein NQ317_014489 [Molorchus minor]|uniref:Uncharacterized protein n=1 Tax=Molorchus minor TaxID=1323400 RepID=A0ABQ9IY51_9CUCU|nr:hypothetical protein NQ317_014489 [Molorchus minor]